MLRAAYANRNHLWSRATQFLNRVHKLFERFPDAIQESVVFSGFAFSHNFIVRLESLVSTV